MPIKNEELNQFKKGQSGNPNGRPPKLQTVLKRHFLGQYGERLSNSQVQEIIESILSMSIGELNAMVKDKELPFLVAMIVKKAHEDYKKGSIDLVEKLLDRAHGKPKQTNEVTGKDGADLFKVDLSNLSIDELNKLIEKHGGKGGYINGGD